MWIFILSIVLIIFLSRLFSAVLAGMPLTAVVPGAENVAASAVQNISLTNESMEEGRKKRYS